MARDADSLLIRKWAATSALVQTPEAAGLTRATGLPASYGTTDFLPLEVFNQIWREVTGSAEELGERGILEWHTDQRYEHPSWVTGSDNSLYRSVQASGGSGTSQDPTTDTSETYWQPFTVSVPNSTTTVLGLIRRATLAEARAGTATGPAVTPAGIRAGILALLPEATVTARGTVELATNAEAVTGTADDLAVTPAGLKAAIDAAAPPSGDGEHIVTAAGTTTFAWPWATDTARVVAYGGGAGGTSGTAIEGADGEATEVSITGQTVTADGGPTSEGTNNQNATWMTPGNGGDGGRLGASTYGRSGYAGACVMGELIGLSVGDVIAITVGAGGIGGPGNFGEDGEDGGPGSVLIIPVY